MTDHIQLPPPDHTEDVQGFVHDTQRHYYAEETMRAYAERLHAARVKTLPTQLMAGLQTEIDALRHQLQTLAELGDGSGDAQILRMGYAAARLEIESLNTQLQAAREEIKLRDAQEAAIGAGGVEPLRRRVCLHKISEPISAGEYPALPERIADETVKAWQERGDMPGYAFDFRGLIADGIRRASHGKAPVHAAEEQPLPLLVRDIAADLGTTPVQVCIALSKLGFAGHSVNMVVTPQMAKSLRAHFATTAQAAPAVGLKDHEVAALVNRLRDVASQFRGTRQLRERIASEIRPVAHALAAPAAQEDAARYNALVREAHENKVRARAFEADAAWWRWLSEHIIVAWNDGKFTSLVRIVSDKNRASLNASVDRMMAGDWSDADAARSQAKEGGA